MNILLNFNPFYNSCDQPRLTFIFGYSAEQTSPFEEPHTYRALEDHHRISIQEIHVRNSAFLLQVTRDFAE